MIKFIIGCIFGYCLVNCLFVSKGSDKMNNIINTVFKLNQELDKYIINQLEVIKSLSNEIDDKYLVSLRENLYLLKSNKNKILSGEDNE